MACRTGHSIYRRFYLLFYCFSAQFCNWEYGPRTAGTNGAKISISFLSSFHHLAFLFRSFLAIITDVVKEMDSIESIRKWLLQFRMIVYTKDRSLDLDILESELKEAYEYGILEKEKYMEALFVIRRERRKLQKSSEGLG